MKWDFGAPILHAPIKPSKISFYQIETMNTSIPFFYKL